MPVTRTLTEQTVRSLVAIEWDFVNLDVGVGRLLDALAELPLAEAAQAIEEIQSVRQKLRFILGRLDVPITTAVEQYEALVAAPW